MHVTDFDTRRNKILAEIIEAYISSALPVGSECICKKIGQNLSSATIRNIMVELEEAGYLEQPHTSAGRVPTDRGWRLYFDSLMRSMHLEAQECERLIQMLSPDEELELDQLLERATELLADESAQAAFVVAPSLKQSRVKQIEFLPISSKKILCVFIAQEAMVVSHIVELDEVISRDEALSIASFLNAELSGLPVPELLSVLNKRLLEQDAGFGELIKKSLHILEDALADEPEEKLYLEGASNLFEQPEFLKNPEKARKLLRGLENEKELLGRLRADIKKDSTQVKIGSEVGIKGLEECGYIMAPFHITKSLAGCVGVLGPKRMDYKRLRALVENMAEMLDETFYQWGQQ
jgi:heat-inducible transcriptional repressor